MSDSPKFRIGQTLHIPDIQTNCKVRAIQIDLQGISYKVTYWDNCKIQEVWLWQDELREQQ